MLAAAKKRQKAEIAVTQPVKPAAKRAEPPEKRSSKRTDGFEVGKVKNGKSSKEQSMKKKKHYGLPLIHSIDRIDLSPVSTGTVDRFTHFFFPSNWGISNFNLKP